jgi:hypothetical protein
VARSCAGCEIVASSAVAREWLLVGWRCGGHDGGPG